eukprot:11113730-Karenia_brevis.AAC.1
MGEGQSNHQNVQMRLMSAKAALQREKVKRSRSDLELEAQTIVHNREQATRPDDEIVTKGKREKVTGQGKWKQ